MQTLDTLDYEAKIYTQDREKILMCLSKDISAGTLDPPSHSFMLNMIHSLSVNSKLSSHVVMTCWESK